MFKITLATGNAHKVEEINLIARDYDIEFVLPSEEFDPVEDGDNFIENARCKALCASKNGNTELYLADDSGLCVEALDGAPGIHSARYAPSAKERINKLLNVMKDKKNRTAKFVCAMVVVNKEGKTLFEIQKECHGEILREERGNGGFGYDPLFWVEIFDKTLAEVTPEEKNSVSHRGKAVRALAEKLKERIKD